MTGGRVSLDWDGKSQPGHEKPWEDNPRHVSVRGGCLSCALVDLIQVSGRRTVTTAVPGTGRTYKGKGRGTSGSYLH